MEILFCTYSLKFFWKMFIQTQSADLLSFFQQFLAVLYKNSLPIIQFTESLLSEKTLKIWNHIFLLYYKFLEVTLAHWQQTSKSENAGEIRLLKDRKIFVSTYRTHSASLLEVNRCQGRLIKSILVIQPNLFSLN